MRAIPGVIALLVLAFAWLGSADEAEKQVEEEAPLRVFIRAGKKTHRPGAHEHERFLVDWTKLLQERGAVVDGALTFPTAEQIAKFDSGRFCAARCASSIALSKLEPSTKYCAKPRSSASCPTSRIACTSAHRVSRATTRAIGGKRSS